MRNINSLDGSQVFYIPDGERLHKIVVYSKSEDDSFEKMPIAENKKNNKGVFSKIVSTAVKKFEKIKNYFIGKSQNIETDNQDINNEKSEQRPKVLIRIYRDINEKPQQIIPSWEDFRKNNNVPEPVSDSEINFPEQSIIIEDKIRQEIAEENIPAAKKPLRIISPSNKHILEARNRVKPDINAQTSIVILNGSPCEITQSDKKITLKQEEKNVSIELKKDERNENLLEIGYIDENKNCVLAASINNSGVMTGSGVQVVNLKELNLMLNNSLYLARHEFGSGFDYETAENLIKKSTLRKK